MEPELGGELVDPAAFLSAAPGAAWPTRTAVLHQRRVARPQQVLERALPRGDIRQRDEPLADGLDRSRRAG